MKKDNNYSGYVDRYLDGVMDRNETNRFIHEIESNKPLQDELHLQKKIHAAIVNSELIDLEAQLNDIYDHTYRPFRKVVNIPARVRKIAVYSMTAAAVIVLISIVLVNLANRSGSVTELYAEYYQPAEINMSFRAAEDMVDSELRSAMILYEKEEYAEAIQLFEKILKGDNSRIGLNLYSGISHMEIQEYAEANRNFRKIIDHKANAFIESAEWYLGLCYLMTEEDEKAEELFTKIASQDGYYRKEAKRILKIMD